MFKLHKIEGGRINVYEPEFFTVGSTAVTTGQALVLNSSGKLVKVGATTKPTFIALADAKASAECPVGRVESNQLYEVEISVAPTNVIVGTKVTIDATTASKVTATTTDGVAEVVDLRGATKAGDTIVVRF